MLHGYLPAIIDGLWREYGIDHIDMQACARGSSTGGGPVGQQPLQHAGTPRAGTYQYRPDALRCDHGIQSIGM